MVTFSTVHRIKQRLALAMLRHNGIHGVGVGWKNPRNFKEGAALIVYTDTLSANRLRSSKSVLSTTVKGKKVSVPVRYVHAGKFRVHAAAASADFTKRIRPVPAGYSIGTAEGSGTAGLIVTTKAGRGLFILSNNHVLNPDNSGRKAAILQPGGADNGTLADRVGSLGRFIPISRTRRNRIDAAMSVPLRSSLLNPRYATIGAIPGHVTSYRVGERFTKVGRTTGRVNGTVESVHTDIKVDYGSYGNLGVVTFTDQTTLRGTRPVSLPGDSGSVWLRQKDKYAAAVNFAGTTDGRTSIAFPIHWAMQGARHPRRPSGRNRPRQDGKTA